MVCVRMGLLDDAIREHLELKRQRGADPGEVAREQREALDAPVQEAPTDGSAPIADEASAAPLVDPVPAPPLDAATDGDVPDESDAQLAGEATDTTVAGETAELDMSSVLGEDGEAHEPDGAPDAAPTQEDSLEWEMPGETTAADTGTEEPAEDVLEETPEFLRDTPEQERLWFEQRPPRDFDFDK
jgi:hypothetical protein